MTDTQGTMSTRYAVAMFCMLALCTSALVVTLLSEQQGITLHPTPKVRERVVPTGTSNIIAPSFSNAGNQSKAELSPCSASELSACLQLLTTQGKWTGGRPSSSRSKHKWQVPPEAIDACSIPRLSNQEGHGDDTLFLPLQSSADNIHELLHDRWIVMVGDSSVRMVYDYLVGRLVGGPDWLSWPAKYDNHGPRHSVMALDGNPDSSYDFYWKGIRLTYVWVSRALPETLVDIQNRTIGSPDVVFAEFGYWADRIPGGRNYNETAARRTGNYAGGNFTVALFDLLDAFTSHAEMKDVYPVVDNKSHTLPHKIWMTLFHPWNMSEDNDIGRIQRLGGALAEECGWAIFNRTSFSYPPYERHPMDWILEIELEPLLAAIRQAVTGGTAKEHA